MEKQKLRIGLLLDSYTVEAWELTIIQALKNCDYARIELAIINNIEPIKTNKSLLSKITNNKDRIIYIFFRKLLDTVYSKLIERYFFLPNASEPVDSEPTIKNIPTIRVQPNRKKWSDYFPEKDIKIIKEYEIDILIRFGFFILRGEILSSAKYGVWSYHHGDNHVNRGGPAGFWESMESWPEVGTILQILTEDLDNGKILSRSYSCTNKMSVRDHRSNYFWKSSKFVTRKIKELYDTGEKVFFEKVDRDNRHPLLYSERLYVKPTNFEYSKLIFNKIIEKSILIIKNQIYFTQWILMFDLKQNLSSSLWRYKKIIPPKDRSWADPHIIYKDNKYYIYIEDFLYATNKAHISLIVMDESGNYKNPVPILEKPYHLSYPFVFEYNENYYMIPESGANHTVELYKCVEFPSKWEFQKNLMTDIEAVDATVFYHNNKWWMFANVVEVKGASSWDELHLFSSDDPTSELWHPHPKNPIVSDCKTARPAGQIFSHNGALYRPSQNCSVRYGYGFNILEITALDDQNYEEQLVSAVKPNWDKNIVATHTFNKVGSLHIIDASHKRFRPNFLKFLNR